MKCFNVSTQAVSEGIPTQKTPYLHVGVGEEGRGRKYVRVALGKQDFSEETKSVASASVIKTAENGTILIVKEKDPSDRRALVLVNIAAGYRGGTTWTGVTTVKTPCKRRGQCLFDAECQNCGTKLESGKPHPDDGMAYDWPAFPCTGVTVLAGGYCADGDAGRMGGHAVKLLIMEPGAMFRVSRSGRLYGAPSKRYVRWTGEKLELGSFDELFPATTEEITQAEVL